MTDEDSNDMAPRKGLRKERASGVATLEVLHLSLVLLGRLQRLERSEIPAPGRARIPLDRE